MLHQGSKAMRSKTMTKSATTRRIILDRASKATLGAAFGVYERDGLILPGASLVSR